jgi:hypothetical protein
MDNGTTVAVSAVVIGQTVTAYQFLLPSLSEVRRAHAGPHGNRDIVSDVYMGQAAAGALSIGVGVMLSTLTGTRFPVYTAVFIAAIIGGMYHLALTRPGGND